MRYLLFLLFSFPIFAQETKVFSNLEEVLIYAKEHNFIFKNAEKQLELAKITRKASIGNVFNPRFPVSAQLMDNIEQQVIFLPAEINGGPSGSVIPITTGQQYISNLSIQPQFEIVNFSALGQVKSAKINEAMVLVQNKIDEQDCYNQLNSVYFNILHFQSQKKVLEENVALVKKLFFVVNNRLKEGLIGKQELNQTEANLIAIENKLSELEINLENQNLILSSLLDNTIKVTLLEHLLDYEKVNSFETESGNELNTEYADLQYRLSKQEHKMSKLANLPVVSFVSAFNWQNASNIYFFDTNSQWINFNYIGLRLNWDFPTTVAKISDAANKRVKAEIARNKAEMIEIDNELKNKQLYLDLRKAITNTKNLKKIYLLKKDTYERLKNQYNEKILPIDKLIESQNEMIVSNLELIGAIATVGHQKNKIAINNKFTKEKIFINEDN